jgi:AhpD family alkylhydroperoxidase
MARDEERLARAQEQPIVGGLPDVPGIGAALRLTPELGVHLRGLADELLVNAFPGATISRAEREMLATAVSASNDCFFCMDSHAAHAAAVLARGGRPEGEPPGNGHPPDNGEPHGNSEPQDDGGLLIDALKHGSSDGFGPKMQALLHIARTVGRQARDLTAADVAAAREAGASDADVQLAVLIAAAFSMYNRMVDGFRAKTPPTTEAYRARAAEIAEHGYAFSPGRGATSRA